MSTMLPHIIKLITLLCLAVTIPALPALPTSLDVTAGVTCESVHALCLRNNGDSELCHDSVCSLYGQEVASLPNTMITP